MENPNNADNLIDSDTGTAATTTNFDVNKNRSILEKCYSRFQQQWNIYSKIYWYYCGFTDTNCKISFSSAGVFDDGIFDNFIDGDGIGNYNSVNDRFKGKVSINYVKRLIKEEVSYSVGNKVTYKSISNNPDIIKALKYNMAHWKKGHETELAKNMLIYSTTYELYYIDKDARFCSKVISPRHGFAYMDSYGNIIFFLHAFRQKFDSKLYIDIYTQNEIIHCDEVFNEIGRHPHCFGKVPVGIAQTSEEGWLDSIYHDIKLLQDSVETNVSDISTEITDGLRNAYLHLNNTSIDPKDLKNMKELGIIATKGDKVSAEFLIKAINDTFIQNTLTTLDDKIFFVTSHINPNEKLPSNTSSLAIKARMMGLATKCKTNEDALGDCIKTRNEMLFIYLNGLKNTNYDYLDIDSTFTPNLPADDLMTSQMLAQNPNISRKTGYGLYSFISDPDAEANQKELEEKANSIGEDLLNPQENLTSTIAPSAASSLNVAQVASLLQIVHSVKTGELSVTAAINLVVSSFALTEEQVKSIFEADNIATPTKSVTTDLTNNDIPTDMVVAK